MNNLEFLVQGMSRSNPLEKQGAPLKRGHSSLVLIALLALSLIPLSAASSQDEPECLPDAGTVIEQRIDSASLGRAKSYRVYLLPNWCELENLPLLIMLHGLGGNHADWTNLGKLHVAADALIAAGEIEPLIILMPDADISWYISTPVSDFETYIVEELPDVVSTEFPVATEPERRFMAAALCSRAVSTATTSPGATRSASPAVIVPGPHPTSSRRWPGSRTGRR